MMTKKKHFGADWTINRKNLRFKHSINQIGKLK